MQLELQQINLLPIYFQHGTVQIKIVSAKAEPPLQTWIWFETQKIGGFRSQGYLTLFVSRSECAARKMAKFIEVCIEVCGPYVVMLLKWTPIFEWYLARLVIKNRDQKDMCYSRLDRVLLL